jgi:nicotinate-nucleotide pyrophosphorylase (carboxylating)
VQVASAGFPSRASWLWLVDAAIREDLGTGDVTSRALIPATSQGRARLETRCDLVICGLEVARDVFARFQVSLEPLARDGAELGRDEIFARVYGPARGILTAERTALNFLQRLSAVATQTRRFARALQGSRTVIVDTRKTTPGLRVLEKYAVRCGGGQNHRMRLDDAILIKDNHVAALGSVREAVSRARAEAGGLPVFVEVESPADAEAALAAGADLLMIDNQPVSTIERIVALVRGRVPIEVTGGVTLERACALARTGVQRLSSGSLTHNPPPVDLALEWEAGSSG